MDMSSSRVHAHLRTLASFRQIDSRYSIGLELRKVRIRRVVHKITSGPRRNSSIRLQETGGTLQPLHGDGIDPELLSYKHGNFVLLVNGKFSLIVARLNPTSTPRPPKGKSEAFATVPSLNALSLFYNDVPTSRVKPWVCTSKRAGSWAPN